MPVFFFKIIYLLLLYGTPEPILSDTAQIIISLKAFSNDIVFP